jgi:hypothetical protein
VDWEIDFMTERFTKYGNGSIGGKGRGLHFFSKMFSAEELRQKFAPNIVDMPDTMVLTTELFDEFIAENKLDSQLKVENDADIDQAFQQGSMNRKWKKIIKRIIEQHHSPLIVRSSSLNEDSSSNPMAGLFRSMIIPNNQPTDKARIEQLENAIKMVLASTYFMGVRRYLKMLHLLVENEKMAVIIQPLVGKPRGQYYFPDMAGVASSLNYFPVGDMDVEGGYVQLAFGLGMLIVNGGNTMHFSPQNAMIRPQFHTLADILASTQKEVWALDLHSDKLILDRHQESNVIAIPLWEMPPIDYKPYFISVYDRENQILSENILAEGMPVVTFNSFLRNLKFQFVEIIQYILHKCQEAMELPVLCEFAANVEQHEGQTRLHFSFLQVRAQLDKQSLAGVNAVTIDPEQILVSSNKTMGNMNCANIHDIILVPLDALTKYDTTLIAEKVAAINKQLVESGKNYILIGPGRWGSSNRHLGVPVSNYDILGAKIIAEISTPEFRIEPSQGSHFFHNIVFNQAGYMFLDLSKKEDCLSIERIKQGEVVYQDEHVSHYRFEDNIAISLNGRSRLGTIYIQKNNPVPSLEDANIEY